MERGLETDKERDRGIEREIQRKRDRGTTETDRSERDKQI